MIMNSHQYKELSVREFTKAAATYETDHAGVYNLCKKHMKLKDTIVRMLYDATILR